jgi:hypothetical protein
MALRVKHQLFFDSGWMADASSGILAGMVVALQNDGSGEAELVKANRASHTVADIIGLAGDDAYNVGNTIAQPDPVTLQYWARPARKLGDLLDETITNRTNWTDSGTAKRGVTVYSYGGQFATDQYSSTLAANAATTDAAATPAFAVNDGFTFGGTNAKGLLMDDGAQTVPILARVTGAQLNGLLPFRYVGKDVISA